MTGKSYCGDTCQIIFLYREGEITACGEGVPGGVQQWDANQDIEADED